MPHTLTQVMPIINNIGTSMISYPENPELLMGRRDHGQATIVHFLSRLKSFINEGLIQIEDDSLKTSLRNWSNSIDRCIKRPLSPEYYRAYCESYQDVIEKSRILLIEKNKIIEALTEEEKISIFSGSYATQSIELILDVFSYFYNLADAAKKGNVFLYNKQMFEELFSNYIEFSEYFGKLIKIIDDDKEITENFEQELAVEFSNLNMSLLKAKSSMNMLLEENALSKEAEVVLSGYLVQ